ncbi:MAG: YqgE/AlgH family protein [Herbaspirillum sp.]|nr:YqgE/AlgH family protein [Herbaspirillum sp.]
MTKQRKVPFFFQTAASREAAASAGAADVDEASDDDAAGEPLALNLTNHFLIAMPSMLDPIFGGSVVYLCEHNKNGALGVVINKPTDMTMDVLLDRVSLKLEIVADSAEFRPGSITRPVMFGGPVQIERGFVLHSASEKNFTSTINVTSDIGLTTSKDVLEAVAHGDGPMQMLVSLGCSGWGAGQLEDEIGRNGWLTVAADPAIIFDLPYEERFVAALKLLGIDPIMLTAESGRA